MTREKEEILYFKTEKERMAYLRNKVVIEPIEYVEEPPKEAETVKVVQTEEAEEQPKKKRGKKKNVSKEVQTD